MSDFSFAAPQWGHALWGVAAFALALVWLERRAGRRFESLVSPELQARLVAGPSPGQRHLRVALLALAGLCAVIALMRPQWGFEYIKTPRASAELMVAIDVSRSMLAEDVVPNRLERAKAEVRDLLDYMVGDHVGLIAFAGRASVLAPMTPDFGFFRLVLDELGPHSAGRGGTRLEEPIRKAIQGYKATGDVSRVLILITDGEDHDSFPLEAAKEAAERGIRIIAIGFGSEAGSEIPITDPKTGARTLLRDSSGQVVRTRLDGATLREMALLTDGVYVPAGTGSLDLESIYQEHIADLMRAEIDDQGQVVRSEGFQWALMALLIFLVASVVVGQGARRASLAAVESALLLALALTLAPGPARAQEAAAPPPESAAIEAEAAEGVVDPSGTDAAGAEQLVPDEALPVDAREAYNEALSRLSADDFDAADALFEASRSAAGTDGEARYRATYGLGWCAAARADSLLDPEPEQALQALYRAGDYFREAVRLQPGNEDPRHNLEIVLQRARVLADTLARSDEKDIAESLDAFIQRQREQDAAVRALLEQLALLEESRQLDDAYRRAFRGLSTQQRQILSDADAFAERADGERSVLESKPEEERTPEETIRAVQLEQMGVYLQRARERMGHARRELRGRRGERAYRRSAAALGELKRARDQLRDPVENLDALLRDAGELARYTQAMAVMGSGFPGAPSAEEAPPWLTLEYLKEAQSSVRDRAGELNERLAAGAARAQELDAAAVQAETPEQAQQLAAQQRFMQRVVAALPFVDQGAGAFERALGALETDEPFVAARAQGEGLLALAEARERFLELRGLIELAYTDQRRLRDVIDEQRPASRERGGAARGAGREEEAGSPAGGEEDGRATTPPPDLTEYLPALGEHQQRNLDRSDRIQALIEEERQALPPAEAGAAEEGGASDEARERLDLADQILLLTQSAMAGVVSGLRDAATGEEALPLIEEPSAQALRGIENLRRLFFSIIEHLRDTARLQQELNDETEALAAVEADAVASRLGPLLPRQASLAERAGSIANALEEQSRENPGAMVDPGADPDPAQTEAAAEEAVRLRRAAELTLEAQIAMEAAGQSLSAPAPEFEPARVQQDEALARILQALEELAPPQQEQQQDPQNQQQQPQQQQQEQQQADEQEQQTGDPSQLLQEVRDREAQRRREKAEQQQGYDTVEKDW